MRNADCFDPIKIGRYSVIRAHWEFANERSMSKLFIILRHIVDAGPVRCLCLKPTSQLLRYEIRTELIKGVVIYEAGILPFFPVRTIIDPSGWMEIPHSHFQREAFKSRYKIEGVMPDDFNEKLVTAIKQSETLEPKNRKRLLESTRPST